MLSRYAKHFPLFSQRPFHFRVCFIVFGCPFLVLIQTQYSYRVLTTAYYNPDGPIINFTVQAKWSVFRSPLFTFLPAPYFFSDIYLGKIHNWRHTTKGEGFQKMSKFAWRHLWMFRYLSNGVSSTNDSISKNSIGLMISGFFIIEIVSTHSTFTIVGTKLNWKLNWLYLDP